MGTAPVGLEGPRESPVLVVPLPAVTSALTPEAGAGGQASSNVSEVAADEATLVVAPEATTPGARASYPEAAAGGPTRSEAPGVEAPEARASRPETKAEGPTQPDASEVVPSGAPPTAPGGGGRAQGFGQLRLNFGALRKRKGPPSYNGDTYRLLKQRKYITIDE
nr:uncharacterized protein LOC109751666 [Aegilops tauschii subsp. strangulata]